MVIQLDEIVRFLAIHQLCSLTIVLT